MSDPKPTELICILDRSGSMASCRTDMEGGFNTFIEQQKRVPGKCRVQLHQFDTEFDTVWKRQPLGDVGTYSLEPRGMTALLDAIGKTLTGLKERPDRNHIVVIVTDGQENSSREFNRSRIKEMIEERQAKGWSFVFMGAGIDAFSEAGSVGISRGSTMTTAASSAGYGATYSVLDSAVSMSRTTGNTVNFSKAERATVAATLGDDAKAEEEEEDDK